MTLKDADKRLAPVCRIVEHRLAPVECLRDVELPLVVLPDFDRVGYPITARDPVFYNRTESVIFVSEAIFFDRSYSAKQFALAHEIGHHAYDKELAGESKEFTGNLSCLMADWLAARWGFGDELREERLHDRGSEYCDGMLGISEECEFLVWISRWHQTFLMNGFAGKRPTKLG
jgi:hypothetical protein